MPLIHFMDEELAAKIEKLPKTRETDDALEEHLFIASCLKIGFSIQDLKELEYKDVVKIMLCYMEKSENETVRRATQSDWDRLAGK